jgi:plasmid stabilization system protein ParE
MIEFAKKENEMAYKLGIKPGAEDDIEVAYNWYEDQKIGLGEEFLTGLAEVYRKLENHPTIYGKIKKTYREAGLKRFPYVVVFEIIKTEVVVYAVFHTSRHPRNKFKKR